MQGPSQDWLKKMAEVEDDSSVSVGGLAVECSLYCAPDPRSWFQKFRDRLFPAKHCFAPDAPSEFKDCIHGHAVTKLSLADRFRVLATGVVVTSWRTSTENEVGRTLNAATCHVGTAKDLRQVR